MKKTALALGLLVSLFGALNIIAEARTNQEVTPFAEVSLTAPIQIDSGPIRGRVDGKLHAFLGIPYAAPPVGELRWMPPTPPMSWQVERLATTYGHSCPQNADLGVFGKPGGAEDCLSLNVFVSPDALAEKGKLPVLVWIHGGSLWVGSGQDYDPQKLVVEGKAVLVTLNYRLGLLGYFASPALKAEGHAVGNFGLMDQQFAFDWVQRNIAAFGGDPENVTIAGESSGGNSVMAHVLSPQSAGKFRQAISMSGASLILRHPTFGAPRPLAAAEQVGQDFAKAVGCEATDMHCLRNLPLATVLAQQSPYLINQVIIDGETIPMHPADAFTTGQFNRVPVINGVTRDEGDFFAALVEHTAKAPLNKSSYQDLMRVYFGAHTEKALEAYSLAHYNTPSDAAAAAIGDMLLACPAHKLNQWLSQYTPTYGFEFADRTAPSYVAPTSFALGAAHTFELPYLLEGFHGGEGHPVQLNALQEKLSSEMVRFWTSASMLDQIKPTWTPYDPAQQNYMTFVLPSAEMKAQRFAQDHHCEFWDNIGIY